MSVIQTGRTRRWLAAGLAATGLTLLAACGSAAQASTTDASASAPGGSGSANADMQAFTACLAKNGVTLPEPPNGGGAPGGAPPSGAPQDGQVPGGSQGAPPDAAGGTPPAPQGVDENTWKTALEACKDQMPAPPAARS
jgi:hypothetical protein